MPQLRNRRWEKFCQLTAQGLKRGEAYYKAGYAAPNHAAASGMGSKLFSRPEIKARVKELQDLMAEHEVEALIEAGMDRNWVMAELQDIVGRCKQETPVKDRQGNLTGEYTFNAAGANKALELVGKELGMFADRLIMENLDDKLEGMSDQELRAFVKAAAFEVGLRFIDMNEEETRDFILRNAAKVGFGVVTEGGGCAVCAAAAEDRDLRAVSEAEAVPRSRTH